MKEKKLHEKTISELDWNINWKEEGLQKRDLKQWAIAICREIMLGCYAKGSASLVDILGGKFSVMKRDAEPMRDIIMLMFGLKEEDLHENK